MKDGNAVLQVIDDGVGMDEETLAHIYDKHKVNYHSNGVGVYNVQKRLKLYYGEDYGITYDERKWVKEQLQRSRFQADRRDRYEKQKKWLSIFLVVCLIGGMGGGIWYRQKRIDERRLSLVYIPKVVDKTNDFWKALILGTRMAAQEYNAAIEIKAPIRRK